MKQILLGALLALGSAVALAQTPIEFRIDDAWGRDSVQFATTASLEDILGTTNQVSGFVKADPKNLKGPGTSARVEVDASSFKTGIEMRDGGVRKALGAEAHPKAVFTLDRVVSATPAAAEPGAPVELTAAGTFEINGVKKPVEVRAKVAYIPKGGPFSKMRPGNFVRVTSAFDITLADYQIERRGPVLPLQVGETARISVSLLASDATAEEAEQYRQTAIKYMGKAAH
ncbi:MAG: YceI family protein [Acidobacteriota bacterium]|nr:YceI family protein [Acidobacteriota bacterium]